MSPSGTEPAPRHVVLVGSMAAGKSSAGRLLAERLDRPFVDNDEQLAASTGHTGRAVADRDGVASLHQAESEHLLEALASSTPSVVAAAASVVDGERCMDALQDVDVVWLRVQTETAVERMTTQSHRRTLGPDDVEVVAALADRRAPLYEQVAGLVIDTDDVEPSDVAARVQAWLEKAGADRGESFPSIGGNPPDAGGP